jgi:hypothetical protein
MSAVRNSTERFGNSSTYILSWEYGKTTNELRPTLSDSSLITPSFISSPTQHSPCSEADSSSASPEIRCTLWGPQQTDIVRILSQINAVDGRPSCFPDINFNTVPSTPRSSKWSVTYKFPHQHPARIARNILCTRHTSTLGQRHDIYKEIRSFGKDTQW